MRKFLASRWGDPRFPAEWDGQHYGGGKGSQRYWEYLWCIDQILDPQKPFPELLLDVGCGAGAFFPRLLQDVKSVRAVDPALEDKTVDNVQYMRGTLEEVIPQIDPLAFDTVTCISVFEHIADHAGICRALSLFRNARIICTLEYGFCPPDLPLPQSGTHIITPQKLCTFFGMMTSHYIVKMETCPVYCENSLNGAWRPISFTMEPL